LSAVLLLPVLMPVYQGMLCTSERPHAIVATDYPDTHSATARVSVPSLQKNPAKVLVVFGPYAHILNLKAGRRWVSPGRTLRAMPSKPSPGHTRVALTWSQGRRGPRRRMSSCAASSAGSSRTRPRSWLRAWVESLTWDSREDHLYYHNTTEQTRDVVRRVAEGLPPVTPARDAYETTRLCFSAEQSADTGAVVRLDGLNAAATVKRT